MTLEVRRLGRGRRGGGRAAVAAEWGGPAGAAAGAAGTPGGREGRLRACRPRATNGLCGNSALEPRQLGPGLGVAARRTTGTGRAGRAPRRAARSRGSPRGSSRSGRSPSARSGGSSGRSSRPGSARGRASGGTRGSARASPRRSVRLGVDVEQPLVLLERLLGGGLVAVGRVLLLEVGLAGAELGVVGARVLRVEREELAVGRDGEHVVAGAALLEVAVGERDARVGLVLALGEGVDQAPVVLPRRLPVLLRDWPSRPASQTISSEALASDSRSSWWLAQAGSATSASAASERSASRAAPGSTRHSRARPSARATVERKPRSRRGGSGVGEGVFHVALLGLLALDPEGPPGDALDEAQHLVEGDSLASSHVIHGAGPAGKRGRAHGARRCRRRR